jgi:hypothetical protein
MAAIFDEGIFDALNPTCLVIEEPWARTDAVFLRAGEKHVSYGLDRHKHPAFTEW